MLRLVTLSHYTVTFTVTLYLIILFVEKGSSSDKKRVENQSTLSKFNFKYEAREEIQQSAQMIQIS